MKIIKRNTASLLIISFFLLSSCESVGHPEANSNNVFPSTIAQEFMMQGPWYREFERRHHRKPVLEFIETPAPSSNSHVSHPSYASAQLVLLNSFPSNFRGAVLTSGRAKVVSYGIRQFASLERYFQMQHAASDSVIEPGHVTGADFVVVFNPSTTGPESQSNGADWRPLLGAFTFFISEIILYPTMGPLYTYTATVNFNVQLIDLRTDQEIFEENSFFDGDSNRRAKNQWHAVVTSTSGQSSKLFLTSTGWKLLGN